MCLKLFNWEWKGLEQVMDWAAIFALVGTMILVIIEIIRGVNEKKFLSKEHEGLKDGHTGLGKEHDGLKADHKELSKEHTHIEERIVGVSTAIASVDKQLAVEAAKRESYNALLSNEQRTIKESLQHLESFESEMEKLQYERHRCEEENRSLKDRIKEMTSKENALREEVADLRTAMKRTEQRMSLLSAENQVLNQHLYSQEAQKPPVSGNTYQKPRRNYDNDLER